MDVYCDNWMCEAEATEEVPVGDKMRSYCVCCAAAYRNGVYHGECSVIAELKSQLGLGGG